MGGFRYESMRNEYNLWLILLMAIMVLYFASSVVAILKVIAGF